jgi:hypothetical protein
MSGPYSNKEYINGGKKHMDYIQDIAKRVISVEMHMNHSYDQGIPVNQI